MADDSGLGNGPVIVTHSAPLIVVVDLESAFVGRGSVNQLDWVGIVRNSCRGGEQGLGAHSLYNISICIHS